MSLGHMEVRHIGLGVLNCFDHRGVYLTTFCHKFERFAVSGDILLTEFK